MMLEFVRCDERLEAAEVEVEEQACVNWLRLAWMDGRTECERSSEHSQ